MQITEELQKRVSDRLGFGSVLIQQWTPKNLADYLEVKYEILLMGLPQSEGLKTLAESLDIPFDMLAVVDTGLTAETQRLTARFLKEKN